MFKFEIKELFFVLSCIFFAISTCLYHMSYDGYLGLTNQVWNTIWAISENGICLMMCLLINLLTAGILRILFTWIFIPYFVVKLTYHISCYANIYVCSKEDWGIIWGFICVTLIMIGLVFSIILIRRKNYVA